MRRAVIYTRISKDRLGTAAGVARQLEDCERLCRERGWEVVARCEDNDRSAYGGGERPGYDQVLDLVTDGQVDVVVAWHSDRLWRSVLDQQLFLAACRDAGVSLVATPSGEFDPEDGDDEFMSTLMAAVARKESADKSRRLRRKHAELAERGAFGGGMRVFGYTARRDAIVEEEAVEFRSAVERLLTGEPLSAIQRDWNDRGVLTPAGNKWTDTTVRRLLGAPRYAGLRTRAGEVVATAEWEPIIDLDTHDQVVAYFRRRESGPRLQRARVYPLSGILRCGKCSARLNGGMQHGRPIYLCPPPERDGCSGVAARAEPVEAALLDVILELLDSPEFAMKVVRAVDTAIDHDTEQARLAKQLGADRARLAELVEMWADGDLDRAEWLTARRRLTERIEAAESDLSTLASDVALASVPSAGELARRWPAMGVDHRRAIFGLLFDHVVLMPSGSRVGLPRAWFDPSRLVPVWRG